jgi:hypothetical protein
MNKPSSTITAAGLSGMAITMLWGIVKSFWPEVVLDPMLISGSTVFVSSLVGYLKREKVLKPADLG